MTSILKADNIQDADGNNIINESGNTITIGASGDTTNVIGTLNKDGVAVANTPSFYATNGSTDQSINDGTQTKVDFGTEILDSDSAFASSRFTVPSGAAGKYYLFASVDLLESDSDMESHNIYFFKNGSASVSHVFNNTSSSKIRRISTYFGTIFDLSASDYMEIYFQFVGTAGNAASIKSNNAATFFGGYRIGA